MKSRQCDALTRKGARCSCLVAPPNIKKNTVQQPYGYAFGVMCSIHWRQLDRRKVRLRPRCHPLLWDGLILHSLPAYPPHMLAAAGFLSITQGA